MGSSLACRKMKCSNLPKAANRWFSLTQHTQEILYFGGAPRGYPALQTSSQRADGVTRAINSLCVVFGLQGQKRHTQKAKYHMPAITVDNLSKIYRYHRKAPGLRGSIAGLLRRQMLETRAVAEVSFRIEAGEIV